MSTVVDVEVIFELINFDVESRNPFHASKAMLTTPGAGNLPPSRIFIPKRQFGWVFNSVLSKQRTRRENTVFGHVGPFLGPYFFGIVGVLNL